jgi:hypothetical protein
MNGFKDKHKRRNTYRRIILYCFFLLISMILNPFAREARSNVISGKSLSRIYSGNFSEDILLDGSTSFIGWNVGHKPLYLKRPGKGTEPSPLTKQYFDISKRKGISARGPEPAAPAFTGFFPGYPPDSKCKVLPVTILLSTPETSNNSRIRPPPAA